MPDCGVHYLWFAFVCFLIRPPPPPHTHTQRSCVCCASSCRPRAFWRPAYGAFIMCSLCAPFPLAAPIRTGPAGRARHRRQSASSRRRSVPSLCGGPSTCGSSTSPMPVLVPLYFVLLPLCSSQFPPSSLRWYPILILTPIAPPRPPSPSVTPLSSHLHPSSSHFTPAYSFFAPSPAHCPPPPHTVSPPLLPLCHAPLFPATSTGKPGTWASMTSRRKSDKGKGKGNP